MLLGHFVRHFLLGTFATSLAWFQIQTVNSQQPEAPIDLYSDQIMIFSETDRIEKSNLEEIPDIPGEFHAWWSNPTSKQIQNGSTPSVVTIDQLIVLALQHSSQVKVFSDLPLIRQTAIVEAHARFDWSTFVDTRWDDLSEPVGNILTTGGSPRLRTNEWTASGGLRKRNRVGGALEIAQDVGYQNSNSTFFRPNNQSTARLRLSYTHPLMRGSGQIYNNSLVVLAKLDKRVADEEFSRQLQSHLLEVTRAYWSLYLERISFLLKKRSFNLAADIHRRLVARKSVDADGNQLIRLEAVLTDRKADLVRASMAVRNAQERLMTLVNAPELSGIVGIEMIPMDAPTSQRREINMDELLTTAIQFRPEINQALNQVKAASVRQGMARNEISPQLDLLLESYVAGLRGRSNFTNSITDQFSTGEPGYSIGLQYEVPIGNRAARARHQRRQLELRQLQNQFRTTVDTLFLETRVAARETRTSNRELRAKFQSMQAATKRLEYINARWNALAGAEKTIGLFLDDLLTAQDQVAQVEYEFAKAQVTFNLSLVNLKRATGTLLQEEKISQGTTWINGLPRNILDKQSRSTQEPKHSLIQTGPKQIEFTDLPRVSTATNIESQSREPFDPASISTNRRRR